MRLISPPAAEHDSLRQPLTDGEKVVFEFFDRYLPEEWEIYLQPHLNGLKPDFVLLHPRNGIAVFEVKDWNLDALHYFCEWSNDKPRLMGNNGARTFSLEKQNPVTKIDLYKQEIFDLYCPRLIGNTGLGVITAGIIFPFTETKRIANLLQPFIDAKKGMSTYPHLYPLIGADTIAKGDIKSALARWNRVDNRMTTELAADLRAWLAEPSFSKDQRSSLEISSEQKRLITTRTATGYRRIKGSAGSGKSIVLAGRAAELASSGLNVLVCTYNITLINYLRDVAVRWKGTSAKNAITWLHFHALCKRILIESDYKAEYDQLWKDYDPKTVLDEKLADLLLTVCGDTNDYSVYDAILVDEGQDFRPKWWQVLRKLLKPNGEMLLVADRTQDVYGTASAWTDEQMINSGFSGEWGSLDVSYRMPPKLIEITRQFAENFLSESLRQIPISLNFELDRYIYLCEIKWQQIHLNQIVDVTIEAVLDMMKIANPQERLAVADITIIVDSESIGINISDKLNSDYGMSCIDTFERDKQKNNDGRRKKIGFFMGDARVKLTTIQSFKGWESRLLVLVISKANSQKDLSAIYAGLTRLKRSEHGTSNLSVVCSAPELESFVNTLII